MRTPKRLIASAIAATLMATIFSPVGPSSAVNWVPTLTWANLHVKKQEGVFERFRREFDDKEQLLAASETQHNQAWIRTDQKSVTVQFVGTTANTGQQVQFVVDSDIAYSDNIPGDENIATVDSTGIAELVITPTKAAVEDDSIRVDLTNGSTTVGTMLLLFKPAGFYPIVKLVGTTTGPEAVCDYKYDCQGSDLWEATYEWSVFKRGWLPEYAQVYAKSYLYGSTIGLKYRVFDIWGTPQPKREITLLMDSACSLCKWAKFVDKKLTDTKGYVSFTVKNLNTKAQVLAYKSVNPDTKEPGAAFLPFSIHATTNELDESVDYYWPQIVPDMTIRSTAITLQTRSRGELPADGQGNVILDGAKNPALLLDPAGVSKSDQIVVKLAISYLRNLQANALYSPDIKITATNGGVATLVTPTNKVDEITSTKFGKNTLIFGYNSSNKRRDVEVVLAGTKPGNTTWTFWIGGVKKTITQSYRAK
jgi:hypothetical protein